MSFLKPVLTCSRKQPYILGAEAHPGTYSSPSSCENQLSRNPMGSKKSQFSSTICWENFRWDSFPQLWLNCFLLWWSSALFQRDRSQRWPLLIFLSSFYECVNLNSQMLYRVSFCFSDLINSISKTWIFKNMCKKLLHTNLTGLMQSCLSYFYLDFVEICY